MSDNAAEPMPLGAYVEPTPEQETLVEEAISRFEVHGLWFGDAPVVSFHTTVAACGGNLAIWRIEDDDHRIRVCWSNPDPGIEAVLQGQALVHELSHAWLSDNASAEQRSAFVEASGATTWRGDGVAWADRGIERAADLLTWAVLDPAVLFVDFGHEDCAHWAALFELLTGLPAPSTITDGCS